jgi:hypothetical protein
MARTNKIRKVRIDPEIKQRQSLEQDILPASQVGRGLYLVVDAPTFAGEVNRAGTKARTLMRKPRIMKLLDAGIINKREAEACEWYATRHAARYDVVGITARYGEQSGGGIKSYCHGPKTPEQISALLDYDFARAGISPMLLPMFERIVIDGRPLGRLAITFRQAARELLARLESRGAL